MNSMNLKNKKIAVVSPNISNLGGISRCVVVIIEALNKKGIIPDYYGLDSDKEKVYQLFNRKIEYNFIRIPWPKKMVLYSSWMKNFKLLPQEYDYIFDFTNTLPWNKNKGNYFSYILYPEYLTSRGKYNKGYWRLYYLPHQIMAFTSRGMFKKSKIDMACVSKVTSDLIFEYSGVHLPVLYPPANLGDFKNKIKDKKDVISVGGITHEKNQLEQIRIAKHFPKTSFYISGNSTRNPTYFQKVSKLSKSVKNVILCPNLPFSKLKDRLIHSEVFLSSGTEDPFSMALIEGIAAGCIPLIKNSGGITEIVPFDELKYKDEKDAIKKLKAIFSLSESEKEILRKALQNHIKQFGEEQFIKTLFNYMNHTQTKCASKEDKQGGV